MNMYCTHNVRVLTNYAYKIVMQPYKLEVLYQINIINSCLINAKSSVPTTLEM